MVPGVPFGKMKNWKETILNEYPRLPLDSKFRFSCHKGLSCFGKCCADVNIFLTPYDVLRMKKALNLSSEEFLRKYTLSIILQDQQLPVALIKMGDDKNKKCPFVTPEGCGIYADRPWACRMYPLGLASSKTEADGDEFCFIVEEEGGLCQGFKEDREWTVKEWLADQEVNTYNKKSEDYMVLTLHKHFQEGKELGSANVQLFYQTCYNLDRFRSQIFESSFFDRFDVDDKTIERIKTDDEALLNIGLAWLRFAFFGESTLKVKNEVWEIKKKELGLIKE